MKVLIRWSGVHFDLVGSKEVAGGDISNGEGGGKFSTGDIVEKMKSICKQVPVSRCSVPILFPRDPTSPVTPIYPQNTLRRALAYI